METYRDTGQNEDGDKKADCSVNNCGMAYNTVTPDILEMFSFLRQGGSMYTKLEEIRTKLNAFSYNSQAYYVKKEAGDAKFNFQEPVKRITDDITSLETELTRLYNAIETDLQNVNYELAYNYAWVEINDVSSNVSDVPKEEPKKA